MKKCSLDVKQCSQLLSFVNTAVKYSIKKFILVAARHKADRESPLVMHIDITNTIHCHTKKKEVFDDFHYPGLCIS